MFNDYFSAAHSHDHGGHEGHGGHGIHEIIAVVNQTLNGTEAPEDHSGHNH